MGFFYGGLMPFAGYRDFADCVAKNRDKKNPKAYCATIMRKVEGNPKNKKKQKSKGYL